MVRTDPEDPALTSGSTTLLVVVLCTARRPVMLKRCLNSVLEQKMPRGWSLAVVVVENDQKAQSSEIVGTLAVKGEVPVYYSLEQEQGIPIARNRSVELALNKKADWIVFIDDDEEAPQGWLSEYCKASEIYCADMYRGPVRINYPANYPKWMNKSNKECGKTGSTSPVLATCNAMVSARVFQGNGRKLRFDENMRYTGGSDSDFFTRALALGFKAVDVRTALVVEEMPASRGTLRWQLERKMRIAASKAYMAKKYNPRHKVILKEWLKFLRLFIRGIYGLIVSALCFLFNRFLAKRIGYFSLVSLAAATGVFLGIFGIKVNPYKRIDGY